ncbi:hypothetical protein SAMN05216302_101428 [Nitrosomonas aestuarii]|uniref:Uncharacterized protein n=1 Tax=Nitrosomonas aestuarii TaxID=52441 RepID=A0A1I4BZK1_9PROT|nr:hypothetical protein [Nitrosomonas aestuarii]SFK74234.1 hypothetical protein SAMN05216302_101428 [Nitrosomonas aestuarii]
MNRLKDTVIDCGTGQLSQTKIWTHIAYAVATIAFVRYEVFESDQPNLLFWVTYLGIVGGHAVASKIVSLRLGKGAQS